MRPAKHAKSNLKVCYKHGEDCTADDECIRGLGSAGTCGAGGVCGCQYDYEYIGATCDLIGNAMCR